MRPTTAHYIQNGTPGLLPSRHLTVIHATVLSCFTSLFPSFRPYSECSTWSQSDTWKTSHILTVVLSNLPAAPHVTRSKRQLCRPSGPDPPATASAPPPLRTPLGHTASPAALEAASSLPVLAVPAAWDAVPASIYVTYCHTSQASLRRPLPRHCLQNPWTRFSCTCASDPFQTALRCAIQFMHECVYFANPRGSITPSSSPHSQHLADSRLSRKSWRTHAQTHPR